MQKMIEVLKAEGFVKASLVSGPNGKFISAVKPDGAKTTYPVGKRSQAGKLEEFNALKTDDGQIIATVNHYEEVQAMTL
jgi:hypothetical protein